MNTLNKTIMAGIIGAASFGLAQNVSADSVYQVKKGDTLYHIGQVNHVSVDQIKSANGLRSNLIFPGQKLKLSNTTTEQKQTSVTSTKINSTNTQATATNSNSDTPVTYTVKAGDTLYRIAANNNVNVLDIQRLNSLTNINLIHVGQKLILKAGSNTQVTNNHTATKATTTNQNTQQSNTNSTYTVKSGDTLYRIAANNNMSLGTLINLNHLSMNSIIYPGQKLITTTTQTATQSQNTNINTNTNTNTTTTTQTTTSNNQAPISYIAEADTNHDNFMTMAEYNAYQEKKNGSQIINVNTNTTTQTTTTTTTTSNVQLNTNGLSASQAQWLQNAAVNAKTATAGTGIRASITVAQAIIESGWGQSTLAQAPYNNLFGIKASSTWSGRTVNMNTGEYYGGKYVTVNAGFRAYDSQIDSFKDHNNFLLQNSRYAANGVVNSTSYQAMAQGLQNAGYATSPTYASTLINVVQKYGLDSLD